MLRQPSLSYQNKGVHSVSTMPLLKHRSSGLPRTALMSSAIHGMTLSSIAPNHCIRRHGAYKNGTRVEDVYGTGPGYWLKKPGRASMFQLAKKNNCPSHLLAAETIFVDGIVRSANAVGFCERQRARSIRRAVGESHDHGGRRGWGGGGGVYFHYEHWSPCTAATLT